MSELKEIGLEKELFLLKDKLIMEPKLYGFPYDEMGFLVELRSLPSDRLYPVITTIMQEELQYKLRANKFGMRLEQYDTLGATKEFVDNIANKYKIYDFPCYTRNVYGDKTSHHLGILPTDDTMGKVFRLTSGIHVHFSNRDTNTGSVIELPVETIVKQMDKVFEEEIRLSHRIKGEYEMKTHGFEYRSLPCNADIYKVLKESFRILRST